MAVRVSSPILQWIGRVTNDSRMDVCDDKELLRRFLERQDEAAFEALIRRHGPLVLDVCRTALPNEADVEDAFQTTFLILAHRGGSVRRAASLASWLHGVAHRTACKARTGFARREKHEARIPPRKPPEDSDELAWREGRQIVHEELNAISDRFRAPLLLCYLEGRTQDEAAVLLGVARSTLKERLERGRALLWGRLVRRGLGPAALAAVVAWPLAAQAGLTASIVISTVQAATSVVAGGAASPVMSAGVAALVKAGLATMRYANMKMTMTLILGVGALGAVAGALALQQLGAEGQPPTPPAQLAAEARLMTPGARVAYEKAAAEQAADAARKALAARRARETAAAAQKADPGKSD